MAREMTAAEKKAFAAKMKRARAAAAKRRGDKPHTKKAKASKPKTSKKKASKPKAKHHHAKTLKGLSERVDKITTRLHVVEHNDAVNQGYWKGFLNAERAARGQAPVHQLPGFKHQKHGPGYKGRGMRGGGGHKQLGG